MNDNEAGAGCAVIIGIMVVVGIVAGAICGPVDIVEFVSYAGHDFGFRLWKLAADAPPDEARLHRARVSYSAGRYEECLADCTLLSVSQYSQEGSLLSGACFGRLKRFSEAESSFRRAGEFKWAPVAVIWALEQQNRLEEAQAAALELMRKTTCPEAADVLHQVRQTIYWQNKKTFVGRVVLWIGLGVGGIVAVSWAVCWALPKLVALIQRQRAASLVLRVIFASEFAAEAAERAWQKAEVAEQTLKPANQSFLWFFQPM